MVSLRKINNKIKTTTNLPKADINNILKDPEGYAKDFVEIAFAKHIKIFKQAFEMGQKLAKELEDGKKKT